MKKVFILEDNPHHLKLMTEGVNMSKHSSDIEILSYSRLQIEELIMHIEDHTAVETLPSDIDIYIIDACLREGHEDEMGLKFLKQLKEKYSPYTKYIVTTQWDPSEFKTDVKFDYFINKNIYIGFEYKFRIRDLINKIWENN